MKIIKVLSLIMFLSFISSAFSQTEISSAGLKLCSPSEFKITPDNLNMRHPLQNNGISGRQYSFWKLTRFGFMFYANGKFYYEDGYFRNLYFLNNVFGNYYIYGVLNGYLDYRMTPFYHNIFYNYLWLLFPYSGYVPYQKIVNINSYIPAHMSFGQMNIKTVNNNISVNPDINLIRPPMPLKISGNTCQVNNDIEIRKIQKFNYEKTRFDDIYCNSGTYDIRNEFSKKNYNQPNNYYKNKSDNSGTNKSNINRNNNVSKTVNSGNTITPKPVKKSD